MESHIYQIRKLTYKYNGEYVLNIDDLNIKKASITGLIGPNGSGKSTLLKLLSFIEAPFSGELLYNEKEAHPFSDAVRFKVTLLTQEPYLMRRSVYNNIAYGLKLRRDIKGMDEKIAHVLSVVGLEPEEFMQRQWFELSGGEAQRVALAARLILKPDVLILDEPTANVDNISAQRIKSASIAARKEWNTTLIIASHDQDWLYGVCDEVFNVFQGKIIGNGRCNIILGPFKVRPDGNYENTPLNGPSFLVPHPPGEKVAAIIHSSQIEIKKVAQCKNNTEVFLFLGKIIKLSVEPYSEDTIATVAVGDFYLTATYRATNKEHIYFYPGESVYLSYSLASVQWV